jgi:hypothetical protein
MLELKKARQNHQRRSKSIIQIRNEETYRRQKSNRRSDRVQIQVKGSNANISDEYLFKASGYVDKRKSGADSVILVPTAHNDANEED